MGRRERTQRRGGRGPLTFFYGSLLKDARHVTNYGRPEKSGRKHENVNVNTRDLNLNTELPSSYFFDPKGYLKFGMY